MFEKIEFLVCTKKKSFSNKPIKIYKMKLIVLISDLFLESPKTLRLYFKVINQNF